MGNQASSSPALRNVQTTRIVGTAELNQCWNAYVRCRRALLPFPRSLTCSCSPAVHAHRRSQDVKKRGELSQALAIRALIDFARAAGVDAPDKKQMQALVLQAAGGAKGGKVRRVDFSRLLAWEIVVCMWLFCCDVRRLD